MKRVVVTGALGHIGSRLIRELPLDCPGVDIVMVDDLSTQRFCSLFDLPRNGRYSFVQADVLEADLAALFHGAGAVIHLAAITDATNSFDNGDRVEQVNLLGTERVAAACVESGAPLVYVSTTSVYGAQDALVDENTPRHVLRPESPYAVSKLHAEECLADLGHQKGLRFVTCRFGTVFGVSPGMRFHTAVNKFVWQACMGQAVTVWRNAINQERPYLDLGDAVRALEFILRRGLFNREIYNVLTTNATVDEVLVCVQKHVPYLRVETVDARLMNQCSYRVSSQKFTALGFSFAGTLERGIAATVELLRSGNHTHPPQSPVAADV